MKNIFPFLLFLFLMSSCGKFDYSDSSNKQTIKVDPLESYKKWNQNCSEKMFDAQHLKCMNNIAIKLNTILTKLVETKVATMKSEAENIYRATIVDEQNNNKKRCWEKLQKFGPGTLNIRRQPLCLNNGTVELIKSLRSTSGND